MFRFSIDNITKLSIIWYGGMTNIPPIEMSTKGEKMKRQAIFIVVLIALVAAACGGQASQVVPQPAVQEPAAQEPAAQLPEAAPVEEAQTDSQAAEQPVEASGMVAYTAPEELFNLEIPASWTVEKDTQSFEKSVVETATSPDGNAFVQVLANKVGYALDKVLKGQVTLDYMKRLYGKDLRVASDVTLKDGREKLEWWSKENKTSGTTYFNMGEDHLYFFTVAYKEKFADEYASTLEEVASSFSY